MAWLMAVLLVVYKIAKVAIGLGFVIFIHELGHFLMAKWNGVKVEKFSIGFGPTLLGWKRGETEYVLAALPLGGFVKMLGEGPEEEESKSTDPRAFPNKSVGARMAIISAGVIMNALLGMACFTYYHTQPRQEVPAVIGSVSAGSPAYLAGLEPGDEIVAINGHRNPSFQKLLQKVILSAEGETLHLEIQHPGRSRHSLVTLQPRREADMDRPTIGISGAQGLTIFGFQPPAGMSNPPSYPKLSQEERRHKMDVLVAVGPVGQKPTRLSSHLEYQKLLADHPNAAIVHVIERRSIEPSTATPERFELTLPPAHMVDLGVTLTFEPIVAVRTDSPADKAGIRAGDRILKVDGIENMDPMRLPQYVFDHHDKPVVLELERRVPGADTRQLRLTIQPAKIPPKPAYIIMNEPVDVPALGLCYTVRTKVVSVAPDSPAARAGIKPGDIINKIELPPSAELAELVANPQPITIDFDKSETAWLRAMVELQDRRTDPVKLVVNKASRPVELTPAADPSWPDLDRGLRFGLIFRDVPALSLLPALKAGFDETLDDIAITYATVRSLLERRVSPKNVGGPIMIAQIAYGTADSGLTALIMFLGALSINLAVLNFLPIPPLDGGQMVFLIAEKIKGKPLPESALAAGTYFGLFLVLCLMIFVTYQDLLRLLGWA